MNVPNDNSLYALSLAHWYYVLDAICRSDGNADCTYTATKLLRIVLDIAATIKLESIPYDERESLTELREHVNYVHTLLHRSSTCIEDIVDGCDEAVDHLCYLLEFDNRRLASKIEALRLILEDDPWRLTPTMKN